MIEWHKLRKWGGNTLFFLFILVVMLDPTNTVLHLKDKAFVLLVAYNMVFFRPSFRFLPHILIVLFGVTIAFVLGIIQVNGVNYDEVLSIYKAFSPLILLLWVHHYDVIKLSLLPSLITSLVVLTIYILCSYDERIEGAIFLYMKQHDEMIMMSHRYLLGVKIFGLYYKSFVCLTFALFFFYYKVYNVKRWRFLNIIAACLLSFAFLVSGTRGTMLMPFFMIALVGYRTVSNMRFGRYIFYPVLLLFAVVFIGMVVLLASEKSEASNAIKYAHLLSYQELFTEHPQYMLFGQGPGTRFYSQGFHRMTYTTEWTYIELIRQYGLFSLLILFTLLYPLRSMWKHRKDSFCFGIMGTYVAYLLVAGTNPLLISSTGMQVLLCAYSFICKLETDEKQIASNSFASAPAV